MLTKKQRLHLEHLIAVIASDSGPQGPTPIADGAVVFLRMIERASGTTYAAQIEASDLVGVERTQVLLSILRGLLPSIRPGRAGRDLRSVTQQFIDLLEVELRDGYLAIGMPELAFGISAATSGAPARGGS